MQFLYFISNIFSLTARVDRCIQADGTYGPSDVVAYGTYKPTAIQAISRLM